MPPNSPVLARRGFDSPFIAKEVVFVNHGLLRYENAHHGKAINLNVEHKYAHFLAREAFFINELRVCDVCSSRREPEDIPTTIEYQVLRHGRQHDRAIVVVAR